MLGGADLSSTVALLRPGDQRGVSSWFLLYFHVGVARKFLRTLTPPYSQGSSHTGNASIFNWLGSVSLQLISVSQIASGSVEFNSVSIFELRFLENEGQTRWRIAYSNAVEVLTYLSR